MNVTLREPWTVERFLQWEDLQEGRHEFDGERIIGMTGGSRAHQGIVANLVRMLEDRLDLDRFDVVQEMRMEAGQRVRYPDVAVTDGPIASSTRTLRDALVLFEVLSDDTADTDRGRKRDDYATLPGVRRYVLLEQTRMAATVLTRVPGGWSDAEAGTSIDLPELGVVLPLPAVYHRIRFD